VETEFVNTVHI